MSTSASWRRALALLALALFACGKPPEPVRRWVPPPGACEEGDESVERWGTDCGCCHRDSFSVSGSVAREGPAVAAVLVEDARGVRLEIAPNPYGNFFRHAPLEPPLRAWVRGPDGGVRAMQRTVDDGSCNRCHRPGREAAIIAGP